MSLIKTNKIGNTAIEIYDDCIPTQKEEIKKNIKNLYNVVNNISRNINKKEIKELDIFYNEKELKNVEII